MACGEIFFSCLQIQTFSVISQLMPMHISLSSQLYLFIFWKKKIHLGRLERDFKFILIETVPSCLKYINNNNTNNNSSRLL